MAAIARMPPSPALSRKTTQCQLLTAMQGHYVRIGNRQIRYSGRDAKTLFCCALRAQNRPVLTYQTGICVAKRQARQIGSADKTRQRRYQLTPILPVPGATAVAQSGNKRPHMGVKLQTAVAQIHYVEQPNAASASLWTLGDSLGATAGLSRPLRGN